MHDGSITFSTALDNRQLEKDLSALTKKIEKKEREIAGLSARRDQAREKGIFDSGVLDQEKAKLQEMKDRLADIRAMAKDKSIGLEARENYTAQIPVLQQDIREQQTRVNGLQAEWNQTENAADHYAARLSEAQQELSRQKEEAGHLVQQIEEAEKSAGGMGDMLGRAEKRMDGFLSRVKKLASRVFVFTLITSALRGMREWMGKAIRTSDEARQSIAQLKGALLTLAQPLVEVVIPAFTLLVNILARAVTAVAGLVSALFGKTLKQSRDGAKALYQEASAIQGVGAAAEEAAGSLAGFDEINQISTESAKGAGGGSAEAEIAPDFTWLDGMDGLSDRLEKIADLVALIGGGFALWKLSDLLPGMLGTVAEKLGGLLMTVGGLLLYWNGLTDAWENGVDWLNLMEMIGGLAAAAGGLYLLLGPIAAGIALVVGGLGMLAAGFHDAMEHGFSLENTLLSLAGILAAGAGIALMTGSWIPLLIAGIAALLLALTVATGHGEELIAGIRSVLEGFSEFFAGIFTGDIEKAIGGIEKIFDGLGISVGAVIDGLRDTLLGFLDWLDEKTGGRFHGIIEAAKGFVTAFFDGVKQTAADWLGAIKQVFTGLIQFLSGVFTGDWDLAWEGIQNIFKGAWNSIVGVLEGAVNLIIRGLNWLISQMNKISFDVPDWVPGIGGKSLGVNIPSISEVQIPRLAQGAVIPPNREFLAVLGDQRSGTNVEAPLSIIEQAMENVMRRMGGNGGGTYKFELYVNGRKMAVEMVKEINDMTRQAGKPVLLI